MPILNPPDVLPEAMRFLVRAVIAMKGKVGQQELISLVAPVGLSEAMRVEQTDDDDAEQTDPATAGRRIADASLTALRQLGMVEMNSEHSQLTRSMSERFKTVDSVTGTEFAQALSHHIVGVEGKTVADDLLRACGVLFAATDPLVPFDQFSEARASRNFQPHQREILKTDQQAEWAVGNKERWLSLRRIGPYLGWLEIVATDKTPDLIPDCSDALEKHLRLAEPRWYSGGDFVAMCAKQFPFLDGGDFAFAAGRSEGELSGGLSLTLLNLEHRGVIELRDESDAPALDLVVGNTAGARKRFRRVNLKAPDKSRKGAKK